MESTSHASMLSCLPPVPWGLCSLPLGLSARRSCRQAQVRGAACGSAAAAVIMQLVCRHGCFDNPSGHKVGVVQDTFRCQLLRCPSLSSLKCHACMEETSPAQDCTNVPVACCQGQCKAKDRANTRDLVWMCKDMCVCVHVIAPACSLQGEMTWLTPTSCSGCATLCMKQ